MDMHARFPFVRSNCPHSFLFNLLHFYKNLSFYFRADLAALHVAIQAQFARNQNNQAIQAHIDFYCILLEESQ